jgi:hypothetical protein
MADSLIPFHHDPLDHTLQSLRLVHLIPELSQTGHNECTITHTTTTARYVCLSYTWDEAEPLEENWILVGGKRLPVRKNLLDFLRMMQKAAPRDNAIFDKDRGYWIDALCINQENTGERDHQVAQMGSIFSRADLVHVWLGACEAVKRVKSLVYYPEQNMEPEDWVWLSNHNMELMEWCIFRNKYWTRAWRIQDVVLAKHVEVSLSVQRMPFTMFMKSYQHLRHDWKHITHFEQYAGHFEELTQFCDEPLVQSLHHFREKDCGIVQDRIFSLFALCKDSRDVPVSYNMPRTELACRILEHRQPTSCPCTAIIVARALALGTSESSTTIQTKEAFLRFDFVNVSITKEYRQYFDGSESHLFSCEPLKHWFTAFYKKLIEHALHYPWNLGNPGPSTM